MTLADDCPPEDCLEIVAKQISESAMILNANLPTGADVNESLAKKYAVIEDALETIRTYAKEGLKSRKIGSASIAFDFSQASKHKPLNEFAAVQEMKQLLKENGTAMQVELLEGK
jgi:hypothetical protein